MKIILALVCLLVAVAALPAPDFQSEDWRSFKIAHKKSYGSLGEELDRFSIYQNNVKKIEEHNKEFDQGKTTYKLGMNKFGDWTPQEFFAFVNRFNISKPPKVGANIYSPPRGAVIPTEVDWRTKGVVTEVKDQGSCGSCWAFSATGSLEGQLALKTGKLVSLSEQNLVDCSTAYGNMGCNGGLMDSAFDYVRDHGIDSEQDYSYMGFDETCVFNSSESVTKINGYVDIAPRSETDLASAVATSGPISVAIYASMNMQLYTSGIFEDTSCPAGALNHGVLAVGLTDDYFIVKNSWGVSWGESGYIRWKRGVDQCGIADAASLPTL